MQPISQKELERVRAGLQLQRSLRLSLPEVNMVRIRRNWQVHGWQSNNIHEEMMMSGIREINTSRGHSHAL